MSQKQNRILPFPFITALIVQVFFMFSFTQKAVAVVVVPTLPQAYVDTTLPVTSTTCTINLSAGGNIQVAIDNAILGDTICLEVGATFTGNFTLKNKTTGSGWITIRTSTPDNVFPDQGTRIKPNNSSIMAKLVTSNTEPVFITESGAHHYRLIGLEVTTTSSSFSWNLVSIGDDTVVDASLLPSYFVFDRVYMHSTADIGIYRALVVNGNNIAVIDSYISEAHIAGFDSQTILSTRSAGPIKIVNNYLEGAGENIMFGGSTQTDSQFIPSDIEISNNYFYKPWRWKQSSGTTLPATCKYDIRYSSKGENFHLLDSGGASINWYQCDSGAWALRDMSQSITQWSVKNLFEIKDAQRVIFSNNILENNWQHSQDGVCILLNGVDGPESLIENITIENNICRNVVNGINISSNFGSPQLRPTNTIKIENNLFEIAPTARFLGLGNDGTRDLYFNHNTIINGETMMYVGDDVPPPLVSNFVYTNNLGTGHYYNGAGQVEADYSLPYFMGGDAIFEKNVIPTPQHTYTLFTDNFFPTGLSSIGFTDYNSGVGGDYRLTVASPYKNAASDGEDVGADITQLLADTSTVIDGNSAAPSDSNAPDISGVLSGSILTTSATVTWTTDESSDSQVEYGTTTNYGTSSTLNSSQTTSHSVPITGLTAGTLYHFRVKSRDSTGNLAVSTDQTFTTSAAPDTATPSIPTDLSVTQFGLQANVSWSASTDNVAVSGYKVYRNGTEIATSINAYYYDVLVMAGGSYSYTISAFDSAGNNSSQSVAAAISIVSISSGSGSDSVTPTVPSNLTAIATSSSIIILSWTASSDNVGVSAYKIFRNGVQIATAGQTYYTSKQLSPNTTYSYSVLAYDIAGNSSAQSQSVSATTPASSVPVPVPTPTVSGAFKLINDSGIYYLIQKGERRGITNPGMLKSYGFSFSDAKPATTQDKSLPAGSLLPPGNGSLVKSKEDQTVYLISNQKRYAFTSAKIFKDSGFKFSSVLLVTNPELQTLSKSENISSSQSRHLQGTDINRNGTIYWIGYENKLHPYPDLATFNSWHVAGDFTTVVPANSADEALSIGNNVPLRVVE